MKIIRKRIADMERATYNPRVELQPGDAEYETLKRSLEQFGMVEPVVWNERTNRVVGGDCVYPIELLRADFEQIKAEAHRCGLVFYSGENRLRNMGDDMTCCGIEGLDGFKPNTYNLCMMINGKNPQPTERMKQVGTADAFKTLNQTAGSGQKISKQSLAGIMQNELAQKADYYRKIFGKAGHE